MDRPIKIVETYKSKFKAILKADPMNLTDVVILFKKLLFIDSCTKILESQGARFYSDRDSKDFLSKIYFKSHYIQFIKIENSKYIYEISFDHAFEFQPNLEAVDIHSSAKFIPLQIIPQS